MAPSTDVTNNNDVWAHPGIRWSCNRIDDNALLGIQSFLSAVEARNSSSSFTASSTKIARTSTRKQAGHSEIDAAAAGLSSSPSYSRFRKFFRKLKHALCESVQFNVSVPVELAKPVAFMYVIKDRVFSLHSSVSAQANLSNRLNSAQFKWQL